MVQTKNVLNGVLLLSKPKNVICNKILTQLKQKYKPKKVGFSGTLDPDATGLLPVLFGNATKFQSYFHEIPKTYETKLKLGIKTDTFDASGKILKQVTDFEEFSDTQLEQVLQEFRGAITQITPIYSAVKVKGRRLFEFARSGEDFDKTQLPKRDVIIHELKLLNYQHPLMDLKVTCSKGTYIRTLVDDIGDKLNCGAHCLTIHRSAIGSLTPDVPLKALENTSLAELRGMLRSCEVAVQHLPKLQITADEWKRLSNGLVVHMKLSSRHSAPLLDNGARLHCRNEFAGVAKCELDEEKTLYVLPKTILPKDQ